MENTMPNEQVNNAPQNDIPSEGQNTNESAVESSKYDFVQNPEKSATPMTESQPQSTEGVDPKALAEKLAVLEAKMELDNTVKEVESWFNTEEGQMFAKYKDEVVKFVRENEITGLDPRKLVSLAVGEKLIAEYKAALSRSPGQDARQGLMKEIEKKDVNSMTKEEFEEYWKKLNSIPAKEVLR